MNIQEAYQFIEGSFTPQARKVAGVKALEVGEGIIDFNTGRNGLRILVLVDEEHYGSSCKDLLDIYTDAVTADTSPISPHDTCLGLEIWRKGSPVGFSTIQVAQ